MSNAENQVHDITTAKVDEEVVIKKRTLKWAAIGGFTVATLAFANALVTKLNRKVEVNVEVPEDSTAD